MFYVAITRAKQNCFISYALKRLMGAGKVMNREKSQFINELENKCLDFSGDYANNKNDNVFSLNSTSFNRIINNNINSFNNNNHFNKYNKYKKWNYYLNKKRNNDI